MSLILMELDRVLSSRSAFPTTVTVSYLEAGLGSSGGRADGNAAATAELRPMKRQKTSPLQGGR